jgi:hypothetical protein
MFHGMNYARKWQVTVVEEATGKTGVEALNMHSEYTANAVRI